jgi:hypothetical protein
MARSAGDEAIQGDVERALLDGFAALAMTAEALMPA